MPKKSDVAVRFLIGLLEQKKLDPRTDSQTIVERHTEDDSIRELVGAGCWAIVSSKRVRYVLW